MDIEEAINTMFDMAKEKGNYEEGDKIYVVLSNPYFFHGISREIVNADLLISHVKNILSSNEHININQCTFYVTISKIPRGS